MSVTTNVNERLAALTAAGTSVWLDQIRRSLITGGELQRLIDEDSLRGVTSNPSIFEKAILGSDDYDDDVAAMAREGADAETIYDRIAIRDVQLATDVLRGVWEASGHKDGFVSLEVSPRLARDTEGTLSDARRYWQAVDRPNLMIKIPGTDEGVPAIEQAISEGINVNVTLLFSVEAYTAIAEAFIRGLERRHAEGKELDVHGVASFFVSRVDSEVDGRLKDLGRDDLRGLAALANARAAYRRFSELFRGERFAALRDAGAPVQRPLWASTGVKNPHYPDTKYVDGLVAPDTVNTMPMPTLLAAADHAEVAGAAADADPGDDLRALADAGIDMKDVTDALLADGIAAFETSLDGLLAGVEDKREAIVTDRPPTIAATIPEALEPAIVETVRAAVAEGVARRVWRHDEALWGGPGPEIGDRLGWLTISEALLEDVPDLQAFAAACVDEGLRDVVLLGMGGSSLGPEVLRQSFGPIKGGMDLHVLDSTDPAAILAVEGDIDLEKTLFLVSSKSGGTLETLSQFKHFHARVADAVGEEQAGSRFVAITDPGSPLVALAHDHGFRRVFENDPNIGGRYSVLSYFGLVPAALMGVAVDALLHRAQIAEQNCASYDGGSSNSGLWLGILMGTAALHGRDKLTLVVSEPIDSFGLWAEQLVAESTGKQGKGIVPVAGEPLGDPQDYGEDRLFAYLRNADEPDADLDAKVDAIAKAGHPTVTLSVHGAIDLGRIFFFAEFATAVTGWVLGINPFDQPNVKEAKDNTEKVLEGYAKEGHLPELEDADDDALRALLAPAAPSHYVAIMGYVSPTPAFDAAVDRLRASIRDRTRATTTFGYGPRFLHSTGQLHKGGPPTGIFLQVVHDGPEDVEIPGEGYGFRTLKNAQAAGDLQTLRDHGLPAERVRLEGDPAKALDGLRERIEGLGD
jgi:transaldolase/glucose-6-phosphate isomerase